MVKSAYVPKAGDLIWIDFNPQAGHEQAGCSPALVLSPAAYNRKTGLAIVCPITNQRKGYPFEVPLPDGLPVAGAVLADHLKNLNWKQRRAEYAGAVSQQTIEQVRARFLALLS